MNEVQPDYEMTAIPDFDPFSVPLDGITLIEASAGTGKTYSITSLYLRLLLEREMPVESLLVVTFTNAATEELRERIRQRIKQALDFFNGKSTGDDALENWLATLPEKKKVVRRLEIALASMDTAAVFTIHSFCQRVLSDHAFDTGMPFSLEFIEDEDNLREQAVEDFWRLWFGGDRLDTLLAEWLLEKVKGPDNLLQKIRKRLASELRVLPETDSADKLAAQLGASFSRLKNIHQRLLQAWQAGGESDVDDFLFHNEGKNKTTYNAKAIEKAAAAIEVVAGSEHPTLKPGEKFELLSARVIAQKMKKGQKPPAAPIFDAVADYVDAVESIDRMLADFEPAFLREARAFVREHLAGAKARRHQLYFDDLLTKLHDALHGNGGARLVERLREQYPLAMIDEFQDTDAVQYGIFHRIYAGAGEGRGLCLIGDPKQAIYSFRGGDIYTYIEAATNADRQYSLGVNWRSSSALIEGVNTLFSHRADPFLDARIEYRPVRPSPKADEAPLTIGGRTPPPLQFWRIALGDEARYRGAIKVGPANEAAAAACAGHIAMLLRSGTATLGDEPLRAADIAVLVRSHNQVPVIQAALRARGINSVSLADASVFSTDEAGALLALLQAVVRCEDEGLLRHALADRLLGRSAAEIDALLRDDDAWDEVQQRFCGYRERWQSRGFIQGFQSLYRNEGIAARLLALDDGERRLTNLLQLVELLQQASRRQPGMEALLRWFADEIDQSGLYEAAKLRLESDKALVKIVTMHASKGLEYPVVYIPFPWQDGKIDTDLPLFFHDPDEQDRPTLHFGGSDEQWLTQAKARAREEAMAEKMRLFYVAVTRAAKLCVLCWGKVNGAKESALGKLLGLDGIDKSTPDDEIFAPLEALQQAAPDAIAVVPLPRDEGECRKSMSKAPSPRRGEGWGEGRIPASNILSTAKTGYRPPPLFPAAGEKELTVEVSDFETPSEGEVAARTPPAGFERDWRVNSYSSLVRGSDADRPDYDDADVVATAPADGDAIQNLPAGAEFGLLVHSVLEALDFSAASDADIERLVEQQVLRWGVTALQTDEARRPLVAMLRHVLDTELPEAGFCLRDLPARDRRDEMEFHFATGALDPEALRRCLQPFPDWKGAADGLRFARFRGLMHGYIDLVFRRDGRYWLADYKSNRLDDYGPQGLEAAMAAHHYPLQALVYALALHRYLRLRLHDYDPARHFGGVYYLFTRGMRPGSDAGIWHRPIDPALLDALDRLFDERVAA